MTFPIHVYAGAGIDFFRMGGFESNRQREAFKFPESGKIMPRVGLFGHSIDVNSAAVSINVSGDEQLISPATYRVGKADPQYHTLMFFLTDSGSEQSIGGKVQAFTGEGTVLTGEGAQCETFESGPVCIAEAGVPMIVHFSNPSENWINDIRLQLGDRFLSLCDLQNAELNDCFTIVLVESESIEVPSPVPDCFQNISTARKDALSLINGQLELTMEEEGTGRLLALTYSPRQHPPPDYSDTPKDEPDKSSGDADSGKEAPSEEVKNSHGSSTSSGKSITSGSGSGDDDDKKPWRDNAILVIANDWQTIEELREAEQKIAVQLQDTAGELLALESGTEMTQEERKRKRRHLIKQMQKLLCKQGHNRDMQKMQFGMLRETAVNRQARLEEGGSKNEDVRQALSQFREEVELVLQDSENQISNLGAGVLASAVLLQSHRESLVRLNGEVSHLKELQRSEKSRSFWKSRTLSPKVKGSYLTVPRRSRGTSPSQSSQNSVEDLHSLFDQLQPPILQDDNGRRSYMAQYSRDSGVETPRLSHQSSFSTQGQSSYDSDFSSAMYPAPPPDGNEASPIVRRQNSGSRENRAEQGMSAFYDLVIGHQSYGSSDLRAPLPSLEKPKSKPKD